MRSQSNFYKFLIFMVTVSFSFSCNKKNESKINCGGTNELKEFHLIFEREFKETPLTVFYNDTVYFENNITTDKSIEVAKHFTWWGDSIQQVSFILNNSIEMTVCPSFLITVNLRDSLLSVEEKQVFPTYE